MASNCARWRHLIAAEILAMPCKTGPRAKATCKTPWKRPPPTATGNDQELREGAQIRAARWTLDDREPPRNPGAPRCAATRARPVALWRCAFASRPHARRTKPVKRWTPPVCWASTARSRQVLRKASCADWPLNSSSRRTTPRSWCRSGLSLENSERNMPELAVQAAQRLAHLGGDAGPGASLAPARVGAHGRAARWPARRPGAEAHASLEDGLSTLDAGWLARIESAQQANPRDARLQYLSGMACLQAAAVGQGAAIADASSITA